MASGKKGVGVKSIWLSVFGSVKFVRGPSRSARGFWDEFSRNAMPGHVSLAPSKCSQPVTTHLSSALQASYPRCSSLGDLVKIKRMRIFISSTSFSFLCDIVLLSWRPHYRRGISMPPPPLFFFSFFVSPCEHGVSASHGCLWVMCGEHTVFLSVLEYVCVCMPHFCICLMWETCHGGL